MPAHFIQNVTATCTGKTVLAAQWGPAVSKNPFLEFKFKGGTKGDKVQITWDRQQGREAHRRSDDRLIAAAYDERVRSPVWRRGVAGAVGARRAGAGRTERRASGLRHSEEAR